MRGKRFAATFAAMLFVQTACVLVALAGIGGALALRPRTGKDPAAMWSFLAPVPLLTVAMLVAALAAPPAVVPLTAAAALCSAAAYVFAPTRHTRFAEFERAFWAHVHGQASSR
ncbi:MAG: hypothetical protein HZB46_13640 [Solirubrobacterales bacterium]|nr:hypothetical protein [Solirubrobacterales bacterium]